MAFFKGRLKRSTFDMQHQRKFTCQMGKIIPIFLKDIIPGDTFYGKTFALVRLAPQIAPVMHNVDVYCHYFFVPCRILWNNGKDDNWEDFITGGKNGDSSAVKPYILFPNGAGVGTLADYLGVPDKISPTEEVDALPFRAYNLIYNEYYRDENLIEEQPIGVAGGQDTTTSLTLLNRCWEKDYFTSCIPFSQRGKSVSLPLTGNAPVVSGTGEDLTPMRTFNSDGSPTEQFLLASSSTGFVNTASGDLNSLNGGVYQSLKADLSGVTAATIEDLRDASAIQRWLEKSARYGYRYIEQILSFFGVRSPDSRLQRPEYIGGGRSPVMFSEILQTSSTNNTSPQGNMSGHGFSAFNSNKFKYFATEHGFIMGLMTIMPRTTYQQGLPRLFSRKTRFDYFFPDFQNLGEQAVLNKEIYAQSSNPDGIFGYQQRFQEYRMIESSVHGDFKTNMNFYHMGRIFDNEPKLNSDFVECHPTNRIFAVTDENNNNCWVDCNTICYAKRPIVKYSKPSLR